MNRIDRVELLVKLLDTVSSKTLSKRQLHKILYLLQQRGQDFDQDFSYHTYGVYSDTLEFDLLFAGELGLIEEKDWTYRCRGIDENVREYITGQRCLSDEVKSLAQKLQKEHAALLDVLSTIVFLYRDYYNNGRLQQKLKELKPDSSEYYSRAFELANEYYDVA